MMLQKERSDWKGGLASVFILFGFVYAWLCFTCVLRQGHVSEDDYVRMTQEIVEQSLSKEAVPAGWECSVRETREVQP
ncbi:hypothetical protein FYJ78_05545 [Selenomonas sp. WCA-380-WT-3B 3/]|uniref:Uncharacterized protein n=1 Tax=Selenomonas montiformis TaxID=2652285 RepID=A0A6I2UX53_9FIRM|nr:hypothetical protein [Selenomonas montiformis]MSV24654.1 hypothetical protein [Selenomonas montiformis]